jgi:NAD(P)-dependent dehydrogenase (short-subunit alcohol dehydrogenase family)
MKQSDPSHNSPLHQQRVLIIGGASGIGAAVAKLAGERGAQVIVAGRHVEKARDALIHYPVQFEQVDLADPASIQALFQRIQAIDHLVITAGPNVKAQVLAETDLQHAMDAFNVKFWGALRVIQTALPQLNEHGSITLTSGLLSRKFVPGQLIKTGINAALEAVGKQLAKELAPRRVNVVSPGVTRTEAYDGMHEQSREAMFARIGAGLPSGRVGQPEDVAAAFILAMENGFITGTVLDVEGGGLL